MKKPCKISASTMARTAALALALTNQLLSCTGHSVLPIESEQLEQLVSTGITVAAALVNWWENNSFTPEAIEADSQGAAAAALSARHAVSSYDHWHNQRGPGMEKPTVRLWRLVGFSIGNTPER